MEPDNEVNLSAFRYRVGKFRKRHLVITVRQHAIVGMGRELCLAVFIGHTSGCPEHAYLDIGVVAEVRIITARTRCGAVLRIVKVH